MTPYPRVSLLLLIWTLLAMGEVLPLPNPGFSGYLVRLPLLPSVRLACYLQVLSPGTGTPIAPSHSL